MSALAIPAPVTRPTVGEPRRRGHLQLVGPGYVPPAFRPTDTEERPAAAPATAPLRLTARGRLVGSLLALVAGMLLAIGAGAWLGGLAGAEYTGPLEQVSVGSGDTLWAIATATAGAGQDVRDVVEEIVQINGLGTAELTVGQQLLVPAG